MPEDITDHELLLKMSWEIMQLKSKLDTALTQLEKGNSRFEKIGLKEQEVAITVSTMRNDFSRAMLEATEAKKRSEEALTLAKYISKDFSDHINDVKDDVQTLHTLSREFASWKSYVKVAAIVLAIIQLIAVPIIVEALKRGIFP